VQKTVIHGVHATWPIHEQKYMNIRAHKAVLNLHYRVKNFPRRNILFRFYIYIFMHN